MQENIYAAPEAVLISTDEDTVQHDLVRTGTTEGSARNQYQLQ